MQDAILAQQASTSGIKVENHVIPTPKVCPIDEDRYNRIYPVQPPPQKEQYIRVQGWSYNFYFIFARTPNGFKQC